ncbi:MAG: hypothetical protein ACHREM_24570, partial [Polyangiales bacterium]
VPTLPPSHVTLDGPTPGLALERRTGVTLRSGIVVDELWQTVCLAPCDASLDADARYRVSAPGKVAQDVPRLHGQDAELSADLSGSGSTTTGLVLVLAGVGAVMVGGVLLATEASASSEASFSGHPHDSVSVMPGVVTLSLSLPLMIIGLIIGTSGQGSLTVSAHDAMPMVSLGSGVSLTPAGMAF